MVIDQSNMLAVLENFSFMCREALTLSKGMTVSGDITSIVVTGMGGSSIGGQLLKMYLNSSKIPVFINRGYTMPEFVDEYTLVFAVSYSGDTEETLSAVEDARKKGAKVIGITTGGKLDQQLTKVIKVPKGYQPRAALPYLFFPMLGVLYNSNIIDVKNEDLNEMITLLNDLDYFKDKGDKLAKLIEKKIPIIYSSELLEPLAYRLKTQINENAKYPAWHNVLPEMNHNEINAIQSMERSKFMAFFIRDEQDHPRIKKRFDACRQIMDSRIDIEDIITKGNCMLARMFSTILLCDFASYYLAIRQRVDPTPVEVIQNLKQKLKD